jgi:hypothetical protein
MSMVHFVRCNSCKGKIEDAETGPVKYLSIHTVHMNGNQGLNEILDYCSKCEVKVSLPGNVHAFTK